MHLLKVLAAAAALALALASPAAQAQSTARLSYHWGPSHESAIMGKRLAEEVTKRSGGKLKIDVFPSGQLYTIRQIIGALSAGSVEMGGVVTHNQMAAIEKDWNVFQLPNVWQSIEQQREFMAKDPVGRAMRERALKKTGLMHVAYVPVGPYVTFSMKDQLNSVSQMRGLKARALAASERPGLAARGMSVVSLSTEEIYPALQSGMIDTLATVPTAIKAYSWWDYLKFAQTPYAVYADSEIMANAAWFAGLPKDMQDLLLTAGREISKAATEQTYKGNADTLKELAEKHGGKVVELKGKALEELKALDRDKTEPELAKMMSPEIFAAAKRFVGGK
jgi:TRAP-type C4-dicarboxylate transport system substrate-binding protein